MKAVAAARQWWAARRRRLAQPPQSLTPGARVARVSSTSLMVLAAAVIGCAAIGLKVTQDNDRRFAGERHMALQQALTELRAAIGDVAQFDELELQLLAQRSRLHDLRFDTAPPQDGREVQSLQDARGRIVGWFSWVPDRALIRAMNWLWGLAAAAGLMLLACAAIARRASFRLRKLLSASLETVQKLTSEDALTGLANQGAMMEALDHALEQRGNNCVALALIDPDRFSRSQRYGWP